MKKITLIILTTILAFSAYAQNDSTFYKVSLKIMASVIEQPVANKYYGTSYGIGGIGTAYHFNSKYSVEVNGSYGNLTMIDPKDRFPYSVESFAPLPIYDSPYFSFSGGNLHIISINALFRYDFYRRTHFHLYCSAGPAVNIIRSDAITGYDVRQQNNPTIYTAQAALSETAFGANASIGTAFYFSKHLSLNISAGYNIMFASKISASPISFLEGRVGIEYAF